MAIALENSMRTSLGVLLLLLGSSLFLPVTAQNNRASNQKAITYEFISPNTSEGLNLQAAIQKINSDEEQNLIRETRVIACHLWLTPRIDKSIGVWADGAENSTVFTINTDESTARYLGASLGRFARQKAILYFRQERDGKGRMFVLQVTRLKSIARISNVLGQSGVVYRTIVPLKNRILVYVIDLTNELSTKVRTAARRLHTRARVIPGTGDFIGDDTNREKADVTFKKEIESYKPRTARHQNRPPCPPLRVVLAN